MSAGEIARHARRAQSRSTLIPRMLHPPRPPAPAAGRSSRRTRVIFSRDQPRLEQRVPQPERDVGVLGGIVASPVRAATSSNVTWLLAGAAAVACTRIAARGRSALGQLARSRARTAPGVEVDSDITIVSSIGRERDAVAQSSIAQSYLGLWPILSTAGLRAAASAGRAPSSSDSAFERGGSAPRSRLRWLPGSWWPSGT